MNHVPADVLAGPPGFTAELARQVGEVRAEFGGFTLLSELVVYAGVPDGLAEELADRLVFSPDAFARPGNSAQNVATGSGGSPLLLNNRTLPERRRFDAAHPTTP